MSKVKEFPNFHHFVHGALDTNSGAPYDWCGELDVPPQYADLLIHFAEKDLAVCGHDPYTLGYYADCGVGHVGADIEPYEPDEGEVVPHIPGSALVILQEYY